MATTEHRKREKPPTQPDHREGLRKVAKVRSDHLRCPICEVTLWEGKIEQHYQQELGRLNTPVPSLAHSKKRRASSNTGQGSSSARDKNLISQAQKTLESVRRRQILHSQRLSSLLTCQPSSSEGAAFSSASGQARMCPVCSQPLPSEDAAAEEHVNACLGAAEGGGAGDSSDSEVYEEYTWCNVTRVRATSMLTPQARANMFDGTLISKGNSSQGDDNEVVDVEEDETAVYGPPQYDEQDVRQSVRDAESSAAGDGDSERRQEREEVGGVGMEEGEEGEVKSKHPQDQQQCLICMDSYRKPLVSVKCWHVYCERCWLQALASKKVCPKCKDITSPSDLRKIFL